jgi:Putative ParB-like nuclease/Succinate dehydrogenase/Fumarate reductase transmembrane subunit
MTMHNAREPLLNPVPITELRPTQITVGLREVKAKRKHWREQADAKGAEFLGRHMIPVILGPKQRHHVIDHHHLALALHEEGVKDILVTVAANLSKLEKDAFWVVLDNRSWMHPFDDQGRRREYADIPKAVSDLVDDPFRSLAGEHRLTGIALAVGSILLAWWLVAVAAGGEVFAATHDFIASPIGVLLLFGWSVAFFYHLCSGIRHLAWDAGYGFEISLKGARPRR